MVTRLPPKLTLVSSIPDEMLHRRAALDKLDWATRCLAPNFLAVVEGTGQPRELIDQIIEVAAAIRVIDGFSRNYGTATEIQAIMHAAIRQCANRSSPD